MDPSVYMAARLRGFGPLGLGAMLLILGGALLGPVVSSVLVLAWAWLSHTPPSDLGFKTPRSWIVPVLASIIGGILLKLAMKAMVMPWLNAPPINARYHSLTGNPAALPGILAAVIVSAGFGEEVFYRAYLFERLGKLWGRRRIALAGTVVLTSFLFALAHYPDQGLPGVEQAAVTGLVFGGLFAWRREIWLPMIVHTAFDLTAVTLIYQGWEEPVAHWLLR